MGTKALECGHHADETHRSFSMPIETAQQLERGITNSPDATAARGDLRCGRPSHRRDWLVTAGIASPTVTAVPTAHEAHERVNGHPDARQSVIARSLIASDTRPTQIEIPISNRFIHSHQQPEHQRPSEVRSGEKKNEGTYQFENKRFRSEMQRKLVSLARPDEAAAQMQEKADLCIQRRQA